MRLYKLRDLSVEKIGIAINEISDTVLLLDENKDIIAKNKALKIVEDLRELANLLKGVNK